MVRLFVTGVLLINSATALAISNIESQRPTPPDEGWSAQLELTADGKNGNVDEDRYGAGGRLTWKNLDNTYFALFSKSRSETLNIKTADQTFAHIRWIGQHAESTAMEAFLQWQEDEFNNLLSRYLAGAGGRFDVLNSPEVYSLTLGIGTFREWEKTDLGTFIENESAWRLNAYWSYKHQINSQVNWYNTAYIQPNLDNFDDYRILFETGLGVRLTDALQIKLLYRLRHNSHPPQNLLASPVIDLHRTNTEYSTAFVYEF